MKRNKISVWGVAAFCLALMQIVGNFASAQPFNLKVIAGEWARLDGSYTLRVRNVRSDGTADVSYFNLRQIAYRTTGSIARAFLLTEALTLEGKVTYPKLIPPSQEIIAASPDTFVNFFRVRVDPKKSEDTDKVVEFVFTDKGDLGAALHVRRGIAEYVPVPADHYRKSDFVLKMDSETWAGLYLSTVSLTDAIDSGKVKLTGDQGEITQIFDMFDKFNPTKNYRVPLLED